MHKKKESSTHSLSYHGHNYSWRRLGKISLAWLRMQFHWSMKRMSVRHFMLHTHARPWWHSVANPLTPQWGVDPPLQSLLLPRWLNLWDATQIRTQTSKQTTHTHKFPPCGLCLGCTVEPTRAMTPSSLATSCRNTEMPDRLVDTPAGPFGLSRKTRGISPYLPWNHARDYTLNYATSGYLKEGDTTAELINQHLSKAGYKEAVILATSNGTQGHAENRNCSETCNLAHSWFWKRKPHLSYKLKWMD